MCLFFIWWQIRKSVTHDMIRAFDIKNFLNLTGIQKGIINHAKVVFLRKHIKRMAKFIISKTVVSNKYEACLCSISEPYCFCSLSCWILHSHNFSQLFFFLLPYYYFFFANALSLLIIDGGDPRISKRRRGTQLQWCQTRRTYTVVAAMDERRARFKEQNEERESPSCPNGMTP